MRKFFLILVAVVFVGLASLTLVLCGSVAESQSTDNAKKQADSGIAAETIGKWHMETEESALDGSKTMAIAVLSESGKKGIFGIRCDQNEIMVIISVFEHMARPQEMKYRIDEGPVQKIMVQPGANGRGVHITGFSDLMSFLAESVDAKTKKEIAELEKELAKSKRVDISIANFITSLYGHKKLVIQLSPYRKAQQERIFDITGIEEAIVPLKDMCPSPFL